MRLDQFLDRVCLFPTRSAAGRAIKTGQVSVAGKPAKASHTVHAGERIALDIGERHLELEILGIPEGSVSRKDAKGFYRILHDEGKL